MPTKTMKASSTTKLVLCSEKNGPVAARAGEAISALARRKAVSSLILSAGQ